jgi:hypothetical protein
MSRHVLPPYLYFFLDALDQIALEQIHHSATVGYTVSSLSTYSARH